MRQGLEFGGDCARLDLRVFDMWLRVEKEVDVKSKGKGKAKSYWLNDWGVDKRTV